MSKKKTSEFTKLMIRAAIARVEQDLKKKLKKKSTNEQTAVEWFAQQLGITSGTMLEQAKEMERRQIEAGFYHGWDSCSDDVATRKYHDSATYYYKTYGVKK